MKAIKFEMVRLLCQFVFLLSLVHLNCTASAEPGWNRFPDSLGPDSCEVSEPSFFDSPLFLGCNDGRPCRDACGCYIRECYEQCGQGINCIRKCISEKEECMKYCS